MPIFVDEVVISVDVDNPAAGGARPGSGSSGSEDKQALVAECVERVLEILAQKQER
ncbi:MAG TPA: DUF5908 family protein [Kofleriaceae bacterium]